MRRLTVLSFLLLSAIDAYARAGGGGGFHGGGGFSGGGSFHGGGGYSGSSGGGDLISLYIYWVVLHPVLGVPLTIFILWALITLNNTRVDIRESAIDSTIVEGLDSVTSQRRRMALEAILKRDPGFDEKVFLGRASGAFLAIQEAWSAMDMGKARAFISDGVHERFNRQIADYRERGIRNRMSDVKVLETEALGYTAGLHFDAVYVGIKAAAADEMVSLAEGKVLSGGPDVFSEVWTFLRRPGAKTLKRPGLLEGYCPSCGAPMKIADAAQCSACRTWVNSGEHDWVLTEITQVTEWAFPNPDRDVGGWEEMREADPGLSLEILEDRAAVAFWRWLDARRRGDPAPLKGVSADEFVKKAELNGNFERDAAVGAIETIAFEPGEDFDKAHVQVRWEADRMERTGGGGTYRGRDRRTHFLVFRRRAGASSDAKSGLRTSRCPACGAAPDQADAASCAYCGHAFNDGSMSWVLVDVVPFGMWQRPAAAPSIPMARAGLQWGEELAPAQAVALLAAGMAADGVIDDRERAYLLAYADRRGVQPLDAQRMVESAFADPLHVARPKDAMEAEAMLRGLIRMSLADGRIQDAERALLARFASPLGLAGKQVGQMIKEERAALHAQAAAALKNN